MFRNSVAAHNRRIPDEAYRPPLRMGKRAYKSLTYFHDADKGGHFDACEQPQILPEEMQAAF